MIGIRIRKLPKKYYKAAHQFQGDYIGKGVFEEFIKRVEKDPDLYMGASAAKKRGGTKVNLGAAEDKKVEDFYTKNGYVPYYLSANSTERRNLKRLRIKSYEKMP